MSKILVKEIDELKVKMLNMFSLVLEAVDKALMGLKNMDADICQEVIDNDIKVNQQEVEIDELSLKLLALEGPVAKDLRFILGCMRSCADLERIGDEAVNIAQSVVFLSTRPPLSFYDKIYQLGIKAREMLKESHLAFNNLNSELSLYICRMDNEVDELNSYIFKTIINLMLKDSPAIERSVECMNISRRFERIADLSTNIAENVVFIEKGVNIKHSCQFDNRK